jgi:hypothetical protein
MQAFFPILVARQSHKRLDRTLKMKNQDTTCTLLKNHGTVRYSNASLASSKVLPTINAYLKKSATILV